ncbi:hypothetical protein Vretifemale_6988 [Volvox reticuliferus]|nr:hypothetical protein Vretifemale_6988 [Volvox reticuliferus]
MVSARAMRVPSIIRIAGDRTATGITTRVVLALVSRAIYANDPRVTSDNGGVIIAIDNLVCDTATAMTIAAAPVTVVIIATAIQFAIVALENLTAAAADVAHAGGCRCRTHISILIVAAVVSTAFRAGVTGCGSVGSISPTSATGRGSNAAANAANAPHTIANAAH